MLTWSTEVRSLMAAAGQRNCWQIPFPARCRINRIVIKQVEGPLTSFKAKLFNSQRPCVGASSSSGGPDPAGNYEADPEAYLVLGDAILHGTAGETFLAISNDGYLFENRDGTICDRQYYAYLEMSPLSDPAVPVHDGDMCVFDVAFTCDVDCK